ncbi:MAG: hypothetical protein KDD10_05205 [Phaeodactylibacter sp.]|nr:hypothetical protein [Phaeodactylibacter sp.]MCB9293795.1 hypothetical protein [Lewinellaceae bacterium]
MKDYAILLFDIKRTLFLAVIFLLVAPFLKGQIPHPQQKTPLQLLVVG